METVDLCTLRKIRHQKLKSVLNGWMFWHKLVKRYNLSGKNIKTAVVLMPSNDDENSYYALLYLDRMLDLRGFKKAIILTISPLVAKAAELMTDHLLAVEVIRSKDAEGLLQYYALTIFDPRFFAAALEDPNGRDGKKLIGSHGITAEEMVAIGIYRIVPYVQKRRPTYIGSDEELQRFMTLGGPYLQKRTDRVIQ